ncbi:Translation initiation factor eIF-2B subunit delta at C-terminar half [Coccomyxa sp. Obi]|nr:Translation initiation factor eIF-2B subunit delta at C-terminar half [Coccomyxa sp. Obi]
MGRRRSDSINKNAPPIVKVVGFRVEGVAPSPSPHPTLLGDASDTMHHTSGSPNPVIIPPTFLSESPLHAAASARTNPFSPHAAAVGSAPVHEEVLSPGSRPPMQRSPTTLQNPGRVGLTPTQSLPPPQPGAVVDVVGMLQGTKPYTGSRVQNYLTRTSAPPYTGSVQATPSAPTTPITSPIHPDSGSAQGLSTASRRSVSLGEMTGDMSMSSGRGSAWDRNAAAATMAATAVVTQRPPAVPNSRRSSTESGQSRMTPPPSPRPPPPTPAAAAQPETPSVATAESKGQSRGSTPSPAAPRLPMGSTPVSSTPVPPTPSTPTSASTDDAKSGAPAPPQQQPAPKPDKPTTRAERRAVQEAQKAAKAAAKEADAGKKGGGDGGKGAKPAAAKAAGGKAPAAPDTPKTAAAAKQKPSAAATSSSSKGKAKDQQALSSKSIALFAHLPQYKAVTVEGVLTESEFAAKVHPAVLRLGLAYADGSITGGNARCVALLAALRTVLQDYSTPEGKVLSRDLTHVVNTAIQFLVECRPLSVSMGNAIKYLKLQISKVDPNVPQDEAKAHLIERLDTYVQEKIVFADDMLVANAITKIEDGDVILTYASSSVVFDILTKAHQAGRRFRVILADARPQLEGQRMLKRLIKRGIPTTYALLNALSCLISEVSKVFLGASAVLSNGTVISRVGGAAVAMLAASRELPVMVCCETYKFHERVQLDSITQNELGDPDVLTFVPFRPEAAALADWRSIPRLGLLNLMYDAMPADFVTLIVTEFGAIPPTSVPVILREYRQDPVM